MLDTTTQVLEKVNKGKPNIPVIPKLRPQYQAAPGGRVVQVFLDSDLRLGHDGLTVLAKKNGIDVTKLQTGQYVVFINHARDRIKVFASNHVVAYYKSPQGRIDMGALRNIPRAFNGSGKLDMDQAIRETLTEHLRKKARSLPLEQA